MLLEADVEEAAQEVEGGREQGEDDDAQNDDEVDAESHGGDVTDSESEPHTLSEADVDGQGSWAYVLPVPVADWALEVPHADEEDEFELEATGLMYLFTHSRIPNPTTMGLMEPTDDFSST